MIIRLQHQRPDGDVDTYHLKSGRRYHIGRGSGCEVRILDLKLSRKHCAVEYIEGEWKIVDLLSTNGCKVDGDQIVGSQPLRVGSAIEIGQSTIAVMRILGDDEGDDGNDEGEAPPAAASAAVPAKPPVPPSTSARPSAGANGHAKADRREKPSEMYPHPLEQEPLPLDEDDAPASEPTEHRANDWEPDPEPEAAAKTGALVPNAQLDAKADLALEAARKAANSAAEAARSNTGMLQKLPSKPIEAVDEPSAKVLPTQPPRSEGSSSHYRNSPVAKRPTPLPSPASELESGPFKSLDAREIAPGHRAPTPITTKPPSAPTQRPSSCIHRPKIVPVIIQPIDTEAEPPPVRSEPVAQQPPPASPPKTAGSPLSETPAVPASSVPAADDRTFFITVFGRRIGPLTRAAARDLKARELKGTLTLKDLDQYK